VFRIAAFGDKADTSTASQLKSSGDLPVPFFLLRAILYIGKENGNSQG